MKKIYYIHVSDPRSSEYHFNGQEYVDFSKGAFLDKEVAEGVLGMMQMFQDVDDPCTVSIRELDLHEEATFGEWMKNNGPGARRRAG